MPEVDRGGKLQVRLGTYRPTTRPFVPLLALASSLSPIRVLGVVGVFSDHHRGVHGINHACGVYPRGIHSGVLASRLHACHARLGFPLLAPAPSPAAVCEVGNACRFLLHGRPRRLSGLGPLNLAFSRQLLYCKRTPPPPPPPPVFWSFRATLPSTRVVPPPPPSTTVTTSACR